MFGLAKPKPAPVADTTPRREVVPAVDILHNDQALVIRADVPGCRIEDIDLSIEDGILALRARPHGAAPDGYEILHRGLGDVVFIRRFALPDLVDAGAVKAAVANGVLTVTLPKRQEARPRRIAVSVG